MLCLEDYSPFTALEVLYLNELELLKDGIQDTEGHASPKVATTTDNFQVTCTHQVQFPRHCISTLGFRLASGHGYTVSPWLECSQSLETSLGNLPV